ncbi:5'-methylthioadenosine/S-adenosylhomocysteine nucleosidase [Cellulomonas marina]|uniref:adenosylhomocysteine nucleosidase n=1 Tax=Cellulomonas marina TaxID=988821 RepID=A0A1I0V4L6_9CELL|nr:5'-methylthioadenosine/S-adenosylhomocysteine nucleosidase [Cellulomonas marina]GIG28335.1 5'-methylthioadenosine/S-adenosylhomocysteine nucleosidase [Cellulomonas marina]SFA71289.1 adenosylhomocysteine nucleosidase [Cellulomonas marina]
MTTVDPGVPADAVMPRATAGHVLGAGDEVAAVVVVAMADEAAPFLAVAEESTQVAPTVHAPTWRVRLAGVPVLLVQSGIGLVAAASAGAVALERTGADVLVSAGSAGGLAAGVRVGDVVVGASATLSQADARVFGYALGQVPGMPPSFPSDEVLVDAALAAPVADLHVRRGAMVSGDGFVDGSAVERVRADYPDALSTDMETAALAQVAFLRGARFLGVRGISDLCGPAADDDFLTHVDDAAERSARVVVAALASALVPAA